MSELKSVYIDRTGDWVRSENDTGKFYLKSEVDEVIAKLQDKLRHYPIMAALIDNSNKEIAELRGSQRWRKCSEELPKDGQIVWAYNPNERKVLNLHYHKSDSSEGFVCFPFIDDFYHGITHWMPFEVPKIPEETNR